MLNFRDRKTLIFFLFGFLLLFLASFTRPLRSQSLNILKYPLQWSTFFADEVKAILHYKKSYIENALLRRDLDLLINRLNATEEIRQENRRLQELLEFSEKTDYKVVAARVIGGGSDNLSSAILIDKGLSSGIKKGAVVISYLGLVGRITESSRTTSRAMLINDIGLSVSSIDQRSRQEGLVSGTLGNNLIMRYLPKEADVKVADIIVTSGLTPFYPKGLIIGEVTEVGDDFSGLSSFAIIKPAVNLSSIEEVLVIIR